MEVYGQLSTQMTSFRIIGFLITLYMKRIIKTQPFNSHNKASPIKTARSSINQDAHFSNQNKNQHKIFHSNITTTNTSTAKLIVCKICLTIILMSISIKQLHKY